MKASDSYILVANRKPATIGKVHLRRLSALLGRSGTRIPLATIVGSEQWVEDISVSIAQLITGFLFHFQDALVLVDDEGKAARIVSVRGITNYLNRHFPVSDKITYQESVGDFQGRIA